MRNMLLVAVGLSLAFASSTQAAVVVGRSVSVDVEDQDFSAGFGLAYSAYNKGPSGVVLYDAVGPEINASTSRTYYGTSGEMTFSAEGRSGGAEGALKASVQGTVTNPGYSPDQSQAIYYDDNGNIAYDTGAHPKQITVRADSLFLDRLTVGEGVSTVQFTLSFDGAIGGMGWAGVSGGADLIEYYPNDSGDFFGFHVGGNTLFSEFENGAYNQTFTSRAFQVVDGKVDFGFGLFTSIFYYFPDSYLSEPLTTTVDFYNTLKITGVAGYDATGKKVELLSAMNSEGFNYVTGAYEPNAIPEPATWALLVGGFGLAGSALRRRRAA
jgi:hypothetical protein